jgi:hypothetical protein
MNNTTQDTATDAVVDMTPKTPKVVGFVDLTKFKKKVGPKIQEEEQVSKVVEPKKQYNLLNRTFIVELYSEVAKLVNKANKDMKKNLAITISKTSKNKRG